MGEVHVNEEVANLNGEVHILMVTLSAQSHINPMLMLAKILISKGFYVTLATTQVSRQRLLSGSISNTNTEANSKFNWEFFSDGLSDDFDRRNNIEVYFKSLYTFGPPNLSNIIKKHKVGGPKFSWVIYNPFVPWVVDCATQHKIPCAMLWIQPCALYSIYYHFYNDLNPFPTMENPDIPINLPGLPCLNIDEIPTFIHPSNPFPAFKNLLSSMIKNLKKVKWVLGNSFYELEKEVVDSMDQNHPITPIGPLVPHFLLGKEEIVRGNADMWEADDSCLEWLEMNHPSSVIYISFGSISVLSTKQLANIAFALRKLNKPFLWVVKPLEKTTKGDGESELPEGFIEDSKEKGLVVPWCNQARVLNHPSIACFISHCGWNSLLEAVVAGVPVIALPEWTDQPANSKMLINVFKMGIKLKREDNGIVSKEEVERCIMEITQGPEAGELKKNATYWKEAARKAVTDSGFSKRNLDLFIDDIRDAASKSSYNEDF